MKKRRSIHSAFHFLAWVCFIFVFPLKAQVANNNINQRSELILDGDWLHSSTDNNSVEWRCVNKALTDKCLVYHNDQWFHFTPKQSGKFFLNISSQQCRDLRGIQVLIIEGNPCEINTYHVLQCIPKIHQDDVFIELDSLKGGMQYLVNVDGFLGDFCQFDIQFSKMPRGLPRIFQSLDTLGIQASLKGSAVKIHWSVHESVADEIQSFVVYRSSDNDQRSTLIKEVPLRANALGDYNQNYLLHDSLGKFGNYEYRIFGIQKNTAYPILLDQQKVFFNTIIEESSAWVYIPLELKNGSPYLILVLNRNDYSLLRKYSGSFDEAKDKTFEINLKGLVNSGVKEFIILTSQKDSNRSKEFYYSVSGGKIVENR